MVIEKLVNKIIRSDNIEVFNSINKTNLLSCLIHINAFSNSNGGDIYVGIDNEKLVGFNYESLNYIKDDLIYAIEKNIKPCPNYKIKYLEYMEGNSSKYILCLNIFESNQKPLIIYNDEYSMIFIRNNGLSEGATQEQITEMVLKYYKNYNFDKVLTDRVYKISDFQTLNDWFIINNYRNISRSDLLKIGFIGENDNLSNGALLFSNMYHDKSLLQINVYSGNYASNKLIKKGICYCNNILTCIKDAMGYIDKIDRIHLVTGIINAFIYKDYNSNKPIIIDVFKNRVEITAPGKLIDHDNKIFTYYEINDQDIINRNPLIKTIFEIIDLEIINVGKYSELLNDYRKEKQFYKAYIKLNNNAFTLVLPDLKNKRGMLTGNNIKIYIDDKYINSNYDNEIINICYNRKLNAKEISNELGISYSTYFIKNILQNLVDNNFLIKNSEGGINLYITNDSKVKFI